MSEDAVHVTVDELPELLRRILDGETVEAGIFRVREDFVYERRKNPDGSPVISRVLSLVYFDEEDDDEPAREPFDGSLTDLQMILEAHGVLVYDPDLLGHAHDEYGADERYADDVF